MNQGARVAELVRGDEVVQHGIDDARLLEHVVAQDHHRREVGRQVHALPDGAAIACA